MQLRKPKEKKVDTASALKLSRLYIQLELQKGTLPAAELKKLKSMRAALDKMIAELEVK